MIDDLKIDNKVLTKIVEQIGATFSGFEALTKNKEYNDKKVVDVGVLRSPDTKNSLVKLYRIQLIAWSNGNTHKFGIKGEFNSIKFQIRESIFSNLKAGQKQQIIAETHAMFN